MLSQLIRNNSNIVLPLLILFLLIRYLYIPLETKIKDYTLELNKIKTKFRIVKIKAESVGRLQEEFDFLKLNIDEIESKLPKRKEIPNLLKMITDSMKKYKINFSTLKPLKINKSKYYNEIPFELNITANYHNLALFITKIGQLNRIFVINKLNISMNPNAKNRYRNINAVLTLKTFTYKGE